MDIHGISAEVVEFHKKHSSNAHLAGLANMALSILANRGVDLPSTLVDEVEEVQIEALAREPGGLEKLLNPKLELVG